MSTYLIWSNEHGHWWKPGRMGYTAIISDAGRYNAAEAREICEQANQYRPEGAEPHEVMVLAPEADRLAALENERNVCMGIGDGSGQRFVYGTYEAIKAAQAIVLRKEALEADNQRLREALDVIANLETDYPHDVAMKAIAAGGDQ